MKKIICLSLILMFIISTVTISDNVISAKTLTKLPTYFYICYSNKGCKVKLTKKRITLKHFDIYPERSNDAVLRNGKAKFKLSKKCKFYIDNIHRCGRVSFKFIKKRLRKHPKKMYSFKINKHNKVVHIRCE